MDNIIFQIEEFPGWIFFLHRDKNFQAIWNEWSKLGDENAPKHSERAKAF